MFAYTVVLLDYHSTLGQVLTWAISSPLSTREEIQPGRTTWVGAGSPPTEVFLWIDCPDWTQIFTFCPVLGIFSNISYQAPCTCQSSSDQEKRICAEGKAQCHLATKTAFTKRVSSQAFSCATITSIYADQNRLRGNEKKDNMEVPFPLLSLCHLSNQNFLKV